MKVNDINGIKNNEGKDRTKGITGHTRLYNLTISIRSVRGICRNKYLHGKSIGVKCWIIEAGHLKPAGRDRSMIHGYTLTFANGQISVNFLI